MPVRPRLSRAIRLTAALTMASALLTAPAQAQQWYAQLSGAAEEVPNASPATGSFRFTLDAIANTFRVEGSFANLTANTVFAHIHCCTVSPNAGNVSVAVSPGNLAGFPVGVTAGSMDETYNWNDPAIFTSAFLLANGGTISSAQSGLIAGLSSGRAYFNIHNVNYPAGEIRGFITTVPEPSTYALMGAGLVALVMMRRRRTGSAG